MSARGAHPRRATRYSKATIMRIRARTAGPHSLLGTSKSQWGLDAIRPVTVCSRSLRWVLNTHAL